MIESGRSRFGAVLYRTTELFEALRPLGLDTLPDAAAFDPSPEEEGRAARAPAAGGRRARTGLSVARLRAARGDARALAPLSRSRAAAGRIALTFDDGPDPDATPAILAALDRADARATFFLVGEQLLVHHELGRAVAEAGHDVALHGFRHVEHDELEDPREDLLRGLDAIESATGVRPRLCRPPYGRFSQASFATCEQLELEPVYWSAWGMDWEPLRPDR